MARIPFFAAVLFAASTTAACSDAPPAGETDIAILVPDGTGDTATPPPDTVAEDDGVLAVDVPAADSETPNDAPSHDATADFTAEPDDTAPDSTDPVEPPGDPHLAIPLVDTEPDDNDDNAPLVGTPFTSSAYVSARPCSRRSYAVIDNCYNEVHPPCPDHSPLPRPRRFRRRPRRSPERRQGSHERLCRPSRQGSGPARSSLDCRWPHLGRRRLRRLRRPPVPNLST